MDARLLQEALPHELPEPGVVAASVYADGRCISDIAIDEAGEWAKKPGHVVWIGPILPNRQLLEEALSTKAERKIEMRVPQRGTKTAIVEHATQNAREAMARRLAETSSQRTLLEGLKERFGLARAPRRVEVYDNSHIQGANAVGAMIVAGPEGFVKNQYRKFNIKSADLAPGDDYAMMREVLTRRFKRLVLDEAEAPRSSVSDPPV